MSFNALILLILTRLSPEMMTARGQASLEFMAAFIYL